MPVSRTSWTMKGYMTRAVTGSENCMKKIVKVWSLGRGVSFIGASSFRSLGLMETTEVVSNGVRSSLDILLFSDIFLAREEIMYLIEHQYSHHSSPNFRFSWPCSRMPYTSGKAKHRRKSHMLIKSVLGVMITKVRCSPCCSAHTSKLRHQKTIQSYSKLTLRVNVLILSPLSYLLWPRSLQDECCCCLQDQASSLNYGVDTPMTPHSRCGITNFANFVSKVTMCSDVLKDIFIIIPRVKLDSQYYKLLLCAGYGGEVLGPNLAVTMQDDGRQALLRRSA
jgi:hypothetical protein